MKVGITRSKISFIFVQMEPRHLRYFIAGGEEQHFGRAASSVRVAQPTLSRQIQDPGNAYEN